MPNESDLIIWAMSTPDNEALCAYLQTVAEGAGTASHVKICRDAATVQAALKTQDTARVCLVYVAPELFLGQALQDEQDAARVLSDWADAARAMLSVHRQNRRRSLLFEATHLRRYLNVGLTRIRLQSRDPMPDMPAGRQTAAPLLGLIAHGHLQNQPDIVALREELDVSAQLLSNDADLIPPLSYELALQNYHALRLRLAEAEQAGEEARNQTLAQREEIEALQAEVAAAQTGQRQLQARYDHLRAETESRLRESDRKLREGESAVRDRDAQLRKSADKLTIATVRIAALEEAQQQKNAALTEHKKKVEDLRKTSQAAQAENDRIMSSRSMRVTAPLRRLAQVFGRSPRG